MNGNCLVRSIVYKATVSITGSDKERKEYIGLTEPPFKQRYANHQSTTRHKRLEKSSELSKHVWALKRSGIEHSIEWSVVSQAPAYSNATKRCQLCLAEKLAIMEADKRVNINKRSELVSKCRHENKFYLSNFSTATATQ